MNTISEHCQNKHTGGGCFGSCLLNLNSNSTIIDSEITSDCTNTIYTIIVFALNCWTNLITLFLSTFIGCIVFCIISVSQLCYDFPNTGGQQRVGIEYEDVGVTG